MFRDYRLFLEIIKSFIDQIYQVNIHYPRIHYECFFRLQCVFRDSNWITHVREVILTSLVKSIDQFILANNCLSWRIIMVDSGWGWNEDSVPLTRSLHVEPRPPLSDPAGTTQWGMRSQWSWPKQTRNDHVERQTWATIEKPKKLKISWSHNARAVARKCACAIHCNPT